MNSRVVIALCFLVAVVSLAEAQKGKGKRKGGGRGGGRPKQKILYTYQRTIDGKDSFTEKIMAPRRKPVIALNSRQVPGEKTTVLYAFPKLYDDKGVMIVPRQNGICLIANITDVTVTLADLRVKALARDGTTFDASTEDLVLRATSLNCELPIAKRCPLPFDTEELGAVPILATGEVMKIIPTFNGKVTLIYNAQQNVECEGRRKRPHRGPHGGPRKGPGANTEPRLSEGLIRLSEELSIGPSEGLSIGPTEGLPIGPSEEEWLAGTGPAGV